MKIVPFSPGYSEDTKSFVLGVLSDEGFSCDPQKDWDLDDIQGNYIDKYGAFFICFDDGKIIGTSAVRNLGSGVCEIKRLYVRKEYRGQGVGLALFGSAMDFAGKHYSIARLKTDISLKKAISIYKRHGFVVLKEEEDTLNLEKPL